MVRNKTHNITRASDAHTVFKSSLYIHQMMTFEGRIFK